MSDQSGLSALRERIGRTEVEISHHIKKLEEHDRRLDAVIKRLNSIEDRLESIENLLETVHRVMRWGLASIGTMFLEAVTGTFRSVLHALAQLGAG